MKVNINWEILEITEEENQRTLDGDPFSIVEWVLVFDEDAVLEEEKKKECRDLILEHYTETDQRNALLFWTEAEKTAMSWFISAMVTEFRTNLGAADYSTIVETYFPSE